MILMTDENKELHELALKGLKYALKMELSDGWTWSNYLMKVKNIKNTLNKWDETHFNRATRKDLVDKYYTLKDSFKLIWSKIVQGLQINGEWLPH